LSPAAQPQRILVVDDNEDALALLADLLSSQGHEVQAAADGPQALNMIGDFEPSIAILDIGLPAMDGYELAELLQNALPKLRLAALTGYGMQTSLERSRSAGFESHFVKPVDIPALLEFISNPAVKPDSTRKSVPAASSSPAEPEAK
jgi:CheY-like chemotaxis protein